MKVEIVKAYTFAMVLVSSMIFAGCGVEEVPTSRLNTVDNAVIFAALGAEDAKGAYSLYFAGPKSINEMWYCGGNAECDKSSGQEAAYISTRDDQKFFKSTGTIALVDNGVLKIVGALDSTKLTQSIQFKKLLEGNTTPTNSVEGYNWKDNIHFTDVPVNSFSGRDVGSEYYLDVMNHTKDRWMQSEHPTNSHETMHGMLNEMSNATRVDDQFVYHEKGKGAYFLEPKLHASKVKNYLPSEAKRLASNRFNLYLIKQVAAYFPNVGYMFDEWGAYVTNGKVGVEMFESGKWNTGGQDIVDGAMDFLYFCSAATLALSKNEPEYIETNTQYKAVFAMLAEKTMYLVNKGLTMDPFDAFHAKELKEHFISSPENTEIREVLKKLYGAAWTKRVFGF